MYYNDFVFQMLNFKTTNQLIEYIAFMLHAVLPTKVTAGKRLKYKLKYFSTFSFLIRTKSVSVYS